LLLVNALLTSARFGPGKRWGSRFPPGLGRSARPCWWTAGGRC